MSEIREVIDYINKMKIDDGFALGTENGSKLFFKKISETELEVVSGEIIDNIGHPIKKPITTVIELLEKNE